MHGALEARALVGAFANIPTGVVAVDGTATAIKNFVVGVPGDGPHIDKGHGRYQRIPAAGSGIGYGRACLLCRDRHRVTREARVSCKR